MSWAELEKTRRLAARVLDGEVVFFIGSGFSIDSEGNTANRLVGRLLAGLLAFGRVLASEAAKSSKPSEARDLLDGLGRVFGLAGAEPGKAALQPARCMTDDNLGRLAREYYNFNDWAVSALGILASELVDQHGAALDRLAPRIEQLGTFLLGLVRDPAPLGPLAWPALADFQSPTARGKALFLDLMGFADPAVMAGEPTLADVAGVETSYRGRLRPRHHVLARIAREGLAPALVTTNYDLLLEGAYRLAGFAERGRPGESNGESLERFSRIAGAEHFFDGGTGYRTALLLKIHGCAEQYRNVRHARLARLATIAANGTGGAAALAAEPDPWSGYLPALVFTYREIQTWRSDAWSRDLLRTLLRTHTIALCGYSGADPVMHATFREVYEEKSSAMRQRAAGEQEPGNASVFYFGLASKREFHSFEILRAATAAGGMAIPTKLTDHPNHVEFERTSGFPSLDDQFRWLLHCMLRTLQRRALQTRLRRMIGRLLRRPCRDRELEVLLSRFDERCREEQRTIEDACEPARSPVAEAHRPAWQRNEFERVVGWTWHFLPGLLRELSLADVEDGRPGNGTALRQQRTTTHYHPASEHPEWTAWSVVMELALCTLVESVNARADLSAEESPHAVVSFRATQEEWCRSALCLRHADLEQRTRGALTGAFRRVQCWDVQGKDVPWPAKRMPGDPPPTSGLPCIDELWSWALGNAPATPALARAYLGL